MLSTARPAGLIWEMWVQAGVYAGLAGLGIFESCYWERLSGASGEFDDIIANDNAIGQFYIEVQPTDKYLKVDCEFTPLENWPAPAALSSKIGPGTYMVGRDIAPGTYRGKAGADVMESCYWERLSGLGGVFDDIIANDNAMGSFFVNVGASDLALNTACDLSLTE